jgi:hypothetical protein
MSRTAAATSARNTADGLAVSSASASSGDDGLLLPCGTRGVMPAIRLPITARLGIVGLDPLWRFCRWMLRRAVLGLEVATSGEVTAPLAVGLMVRVDAFHCRSICTSCFWRLDAGFATTVGANNGSASVDRSREKNVCAVGGLGDKRCKHKALHSTETYRQGRYTAPPYPQTLAPRNASGSACPHCVVAESTQRDHGSVAGE